jgi:hypothetical protein
MEIKIFKHFEGKVSFGGQIPLIWLMVIVVGRRNGLIIGGELETDNSTTTSKLMKI